MFSKTKSSKTSSNSTNPLETLKDFGSSTVDNTLDSFKQMGNGIFDQLIGKAPKEEKEEDFEQKAVEKKGKSVGSRKEFSIFSYQEYYESKIIKDQIKELTEAIRKEIEMVKRADNSLLSEVSDIEKLTINALPEKTGIYHVRFLEIILSLLRTVRAKIGESKTWLSAMVSKRKKRGSLFASLSKKKGTQFSLSQELSSSRSIQ